MGLSHILYLLTLIFQFDCEAVQYSTQATLKELGLKLGDVFSLKAFAERRLSQDESAEQNKDERKRKLLDFLQKKADHSQPKRSCTNLSSGKASAKPKTRRVLLGLMKYDMKKKKYTRVSLIKGGGTRKVDLPLVFNQGSPEAPATGENRRLVVAEAPATHRKIFFLKSGIIYPWYCF